MSQDVNGRDYVSDYICNECGRIVSVYEQRMTVHMRNHSQHICFECAFWLSKAGNLKPFEQIINNQLFSFPPEIKEGGKVRHILTVDGEVIGSTELFNQGKIPDRFLNLFPTTAHFINGHFLRKLKTNRNFHCRRLGCWDRLHCLWFQEENKDWNKIPENHVVGTEECPMFINKLNPHV